MMQKLTKINILLWISLLLVGCSGRGNTNSDLPVIESQGSISLVVNGEDFAREAFTTKDGWEINFERVEVTVGEVTAYQVEGSFNPEAKSEIKSEKSILLLQEPQTLNLARETEGGKPILIKETKAAEGFYNALSWQMVTKKDQNFPDGQTILLEGTGTKGNRKIEFLLGFNERIEYVCGEFIGDTRKGIVKSGENTEVEMTFHLDHIFGDGTAKTEAEINQNALGFEPLAKLAASDNLKLSQQELQTKLSPEAYQKLQKAIAGLGHVGEGHCAAKIPNLTRNVEKEPQ